jgi:hypothetical protein
MTDAQGRFAFKNVAAGAYRLALSANGYVRQEYGQRVFPGRGAVFQLADGQTLKNLVAELTPTGSVSGTIRDEDKRPLAGVPVQLMRVNYDQSGERRLRPVGNVVKTDDRGEYRIYFVTPGRYYVNAGTPQGPPGTGDQRAAPNEILETYAYVYFPGVAELNLATSIDVQPGATRTGTDLTLNKIKGVRVSGRVIDGVTGQPPENPKVKLAYRDPGVPWDYDLEYMGRGKVTYNNKDGKFEFRDVLPGLFAVVVTVDVPGQTPPAQGTTPHQRIGYLPLDVRSANVDGIVITASPGSSISGRLRVEGTNDLAGVFVNTTAKPGVTLEPSSNGVQPATPGVPTPNYGPFNPDGTFRIDNVMPGEFRFQVSWLRSSFYIKEARYGATDILLQPFQFRGNEDSSLEIVLSPNVAAVEGVVLNNRLEGAPGAQVVLVPDRSRHRPTLFRTIATDQNGRFRLTNVAPGDYKVYAWEAVELYRWFDMDFLKGFEQSARSIHLGESSNQTVDLRLIPAPGR